MLGRGRRQSLDILFTLWICWTARQACGLDRTASWKRSGSASYANGACWDPRVSPCNAGALSFHVTVSPDRSEVTLDDSQEHCAIARLAPGYGSALRRSSSADPSGVSLTVLDKAEISGYVNAIHASFTAAQDAVFAGCGAQVFASSGGVVTILAPAYCSTGLTTVMILPFPVRRKSRDRPRKARAKEASRDGGAHRVAPSRRRSLCLVPLLERYVVRRCLGKGAHGKVLLLEGRRDAGRRLLVKIANGGRDAFAALLNEVRLLSSQGLGTVHRLHGLLLRGGVVCGFATEYVPGETLEERLARGPVAVGDGEPLARSIAGAVVGFLKSGVIHCDLKPAHIHLGADGRVRIIDLGVACRSGREGPRAVQGTLLYASPEQIDGNGPTRVDERSDLFSLGLILYEVLCGHSFFPAVKTDIATFVRLRRERLEEPLLLPADCPSLLAQLIRRLLLADPEQRAGLQELAGMLTRWEPSGSQPYLEKRQHATVEAGCHGGPRARDLNSTATPSEATKSAFTSTSSGSFLGGSHGS